MYLLNKRFSKMISGCLLLEAWGESTALPSVCVVVFFPAWKLICSTFKANKGRQ